MSLSVLSIWESELSYFRYYSQTNTAGNGYLKCWGFCAYALDISFGSLCNVLKITGC